MTAPNIVNVTSIYGKTYAKALTTSTVNHVTCGSDKVIKINSIIVSNIHASDAATVNVAFYDGVDGADYQLAQTVSVPNASTLVVIGKDSPIYLEETDRIRAAASANSTLHIVISYEELDDA